MVDVALSEPVSRRWREMVAGRAEGRVLEVGFGSGHNLEHYTDAVTEVLAVEPIDLAWHRAAHRVEAFDRPVRRVGLDGAELPVADASVDTVVSTWTMCTIPHIDAAVREMRRVLRPGGRVLYVEHVLSPNDRARSIQRGMQPVWGPLAGGCHLDRDIDALLETGGFTITPLTPRPASDRFELVPFIAGEATPTH
jgi:ubiquinone/menaquinone biosynthesis C-methylase UbiE